MGNGLIGFFVDDFEGVHRVFLGLVGRSGECATKIPKEIRYCSVSRKHAEISFVDGEVFIRDFDSKFGTFIQGKKVLGNFVPLKDGYEVRLGEVNFRFNYSQNRDAEELGV